tara:strand:- start:129 stop:311 length:183 start_codon:yes stop_codon:yes gene_type:complete
MSQKAALSAGVYHKSSVNGSFCSVIGMVSNGRGPAVLEDDIYDSVSFPYFNTIGTAIVQQ